MDFVTILSRPVTRLSGELVQLYATMNVRTFRFSMYAVCGWLILVNGVRAFSVPWSGTPLQWFAVSLDLVVIGIIALPPIRALYSQKYRLRLAEADERFRNSPVLRRGAWFLSGVWAVLITSQLLGWTYGPLMQTMGVGFLK